MPEVDANYAQFANSYDQFQSTTLGILEQQLFSLCIKDCHEMKVLDLGGGTGARTRDALKAGAKSIDLVDITQEMMDIGRKKMDDEKLEGREQVKWHHGDVARSMARLPLQEGSYDMVIANGIFDHARNDAELQMMFLNASTYLKPGGQLIANRNNAFSKVAFPKTGAKYGVMFTDFKDLPGGGGQAYQYYVRTEPILGFQSIALDCYSNETWKTIPERFFKDFETVDWKETPVVKNDMEFWREYLKDPILYIYTARNKPDDEVH